MHINKFECENKDDCVQGRKKILKVYYSSVKVIRNILIKKQTWKNYIREFVVIFYIKSLLKNRLSYLF